MSTTKTNFIYNSLLGLTNILVPLITFPYITRVLGPSGVGITSFAISLVTTFIILCSLGIPIYGIREIAKSKKNQKKLNKTFSELLIIQIIWTLFVLILFTLWLYLTKTYENERALKYFSYVHIVSSLGLINWFYQGLEKYKFITILNSLIKILTIILLFLIVKNPNDYWIYYAILVLSTAMGAVASFFFSLKYIKIRIRNLDFKKHFKPIIILFSTQIAIGIYVNIDIIMLKYFTSIAQVGYYATSMKLVKTVLILVTSLGVVLIPKIASFIEENRIKEVKNIIEKSINFVLIISLPLIVGLYLTSKDLIILFAGNKFLESSQLMLWLLPLVIFIGLNNIFGLQILVPSNKEKHLMIIVITGAVLNFTLNFILIPVYGGYGAAFATVVTEMLITASTFYYCRKAILFYFPYKKFIKYLLISIVFIPISMFVSKLTPKGISFLITTGVICTVYYIVTLTLIKDKFFKTHILSPILNKILK